MAGAQRLTLLAVIMGSFVVNVDATVTNVALPTIARELGGGLAGQQWVANGYLLTLGAFMLLGGSIGDLFGERRVFAFGVAGFGVGSLLCALAPSIGTLIAARAVQGLAGALLTPAALAVIVATFTGSERGAAIGTWTAWGGIALVFGPLAGGELLSLVSWRWIFAVNLPFVLFTLALVPRIPARAATRAPIDWRGALLAVLGLAGPVFALIEQPRLGWASPAVWGSGSAGVALLIAFLAWERRAPAPMLPLGLFAERNFSAGNLETFAMYGGLGGFSFFVVLYLQQVAGYTPLEGGLATLPITIVMFALSRRFGRLADRVGFRPFMGLGPIVSAAGLLMLVRLGTDVSFAADLLPAMVVFALGLSLTVAPLTAAVLAGADEHRAGIASAVNNTVARVAGLIAVAAIGAVMSAHFGADLRARLPTLAPPDRAAVAAAERQPLGVPAGAPRAVRTAARAASVSTFHLGAELVAGLLACGGLIGLVGIRDRPRRRHEAEECGPARLEPAAGHGVHLQLSRGRRPAVPAAAPAVGIGLPDVPVADNAGSNPG